MSLAIEIDRAKEVEQINAAKILNNEQQIANIKSPWSSEQNMVFIENVSKVGIGNNNPSESLDVTGNVKADVFIGQLNGQLMDPIQNNIYRTQRLEKVSGDSPVISIDSDLITEKRCAYHEGLHVEGI